MRWAWTTVIWTLLVTGCGDSPGAATGLVSADAPTDIDDPAEVSPAEVSPAEVSPAEVSPGESDASYPSDSNTIDVGSTPADSEGPPLDGAASPDATDDGDADGPSDAGAAEDEQEVVITQDAEVLVDSATPTDADSILPDVDTGDAGDAGGGPLTQAFSVLTINLHCLKLDPTSFSSNEARLGAIAVLVAAENVVALTVQEACVKGSLDAMAMLKQALESATAASWSSAWEPAHIAWAGTPDEAQEGVGVFVKGALSAPKTLHYVEQSGLIRLAVGATLPVEYGAFDLWSVHLDFQVADVREAQARETAQSALTLADPSLDVIVGGDFNAPKGSPPYLAFTQAGFQDLTATEGADEIDHIFAHRAAKVTLVGSKTVFVGDGSPVVSDHPGMLVRLTLGPGQSIPVTRLVANVDVGWGNRLTLRGDTTPLSWNRGWYAVYTDPGEWKAVLTELPAGAPLNYKWLRNDSDFQLGGNVSGVAGQTNTATPTF